MTKEKALSIISSVGVFILFEVLAFVSFGLSNSYIVYALLGVAAMLLLFVALFFEIKKEGFSEIAIFVMPIFLLSLIFSLSSFSNAVNTSIFVRILIPLGLMSFALCGYLSKRGKGFNISTALIVIYGGLALITLISYFATMIQYVPFYTIIYRDAYIYYNGARADFPIGKTAYFLAGFSFREVSVDYFSLYPSVLSSSVIALFFISPKEEKKKFIIYAIYAFIGLVALITMPTKMTLITSFLIVVSLVVVILFNKNKLNSKILSRVLLTLLIIFMFLFLILVLNAQTWAATAWLRNLISKSSLLNKLFNTNGFSSRYNEILREAFGMDRLIGFFPSLEYVSELHFGFLTNSMLFDTILFSGLFGLIIFVVLAVFIVKTIIKYYRFSSDISLYKALITSFLLTFFIYSMINFDSQPYIFYSDVNPYYFNGLFLVSLFLYGYVYFSSKEKKAESVLDAKEEIVDEEVL